MLEKILEKIKECAKYSNIAVIYDFDVDGCASASIIWRAFQAMHIQATFYPNTRSFQNITIERIRKQNPDKIVTVDHVPDNELTEFLKNYNTTVLDHHLHEKHLEVLDYLTAADYNLKGSMCYVLYKSLKSKLKDAEWIVKLSLFWDKCLEYTEFYKEGIYQEELETYMPFNLVVCLTQVKGSEKMLELLNQCANLEEALGKIRMLEDYRRAKSTFDEELKDILFSRRTFTDIRLNIYWVKTKFKHMRIYVDYITYSKEGTNIFIINEVTQFKFSFRTSLEIDLVKIIKKIHEDFKEFSGGGHAKACGAILRSEQAEEILDKFIALYREELKE